MNDTTDIIIPVAGGLKITRDCVESIVAHTQVPYRLIIIDNLSDPETKEYLRGVRIPAPGEYLLVENAENRGWVGSINQGFGIASAPFVCIMNNDVIVSSGWLENMLKVMAAHSHIGMINPKWEKTQFPDLKQDHIEMDWCRGFCILMRREVIEKVGLLDKAYGFGYWDDYDYSIRAINAGWALALALNSFVEHIGNVSFKKAMRPREWTELFEKNRMIFEKKWGRPKRVVVVVDRKTAGDDLKYKGVLSRIKELLKSRHKVYVFSDRHDLELPRHTNIKYVKCVPFFLALDVWIRLFFNKRRKKDKHYNEIYGEPECPGSVDLVLLSVFMVLVTWQPFTLAGELYTFELGLYSSGIDGVLKGMVPYRDFFHLRGPLELYIPAFFMNILGRNFYILPYYFYIGTIATLLGCLLLVKALFRSRLMFYLAGLVIVARTFPRVYFNYWGGFRYAFGIFCLWCLVKYMRRGKAGWMFGAGFLAVCGLLTSIEVGVCALAGALAMFAALFIWRIREGQALRKAFGAFCMGVLVPAGSYLVYLLATRSLGAYWEAQYSVVTNMTAVFNDKYSLAYPSGIIGVLQGFMPTSPYFKHLTPVFLYLCLSGYLFHARRKLRSSWEAPALVGIAAYGLIMYIAAWRKIENAQFEMALQPSKVLMFYLIERAYFQWGGSKAPVFKGRVIFAGMLTFAVAASSVGFAVTTFDHRFVSVKIARNFLTGRDIGQFNPLNNVESKTPGIPGWEGVVLPKAQAEEFEQLAGFFDRNTHKDDVVFMYPENAFYSYVIDRPFLGRFPMASFSWLNERWHQELLQALAMQKPRYIVFPKVLPPGFEGVYFKVGANRDKFEAVMRIIKSRYKIAGITPLSYILEKK